MVTDLFVRHLEAKYIHQLIKMVSLKSSDDARELLGHYLMTYHYSETQTFILKLRKLCKVRSRDRDDFEVADGDDVSRLVRDKLSKNSKALNLLRDLLLEKTSLILEKKSFKRSQGYKSLQKLQETFLLSDTELKILEFHYVKEASSVFDGIHFDALDDALIRSGKLYSRLFGCSLKDLKSSFSKGGALYKSCLLEDRGHGGLSLDDYTASYISGYEKTPVSENFLMKEGLKTAFELDEFSLSKRDLSSIELLFGSQKAGSKVLLYGKPGTGKTEFVRALSKSLGRDLYIIRSEDSNGGDSLNQRQRAVIASQNIFRTSRPIVLVDEADSILNTQHAYFGCEKNTHSDSKAWINSVLESDSVDMIWISNHIDGIDESTKRRFNYSVKFDDLTSSQREKIWEVSQKRYNKLFSSSEMNELAEVHAVNAGSVGIAYKSAQNLPTGIARKEKKELVKSIVKNHDSFIGGGSKDKLSVSNFYDPEVVSTDMSVENIISTTRDFYKFLEEEWGSNPPIQNLNLLFSGASGTGKTEFAKYIAKTLGKKLLQKNASDIFDKYVGETEKRIAQMFEQAEREGAILFLDEADSLFTSREAATQSWQVAWTNELLVQMEKFKGVLICSTNFVENLDHASMRRFNLKVRFDVLRDAAKVKLFNSMLKKLSDEQIDKEQELLIESIPNLTVGDFKTVYQRNFFLQGITNHYLIEELKLEVSYKGKRSRKLGL